MVSRNPDSTSPSVKQRAGKSQLDIFGTPMPVKTPVNFDQRMEMSKASNKAA